YFRKRIAGFLSTFPEGARRDRTLLTHPLSLTLIAFLFTAIPSFLLKKMIDKHLESIVLMAWALIIGGVVMWVVDVRYATGSRTTDMDQMSLGQAIWIGICQVVSAVIP